LFLGVFNSGLFDFNRVLFLPLLIILILHHLLRLIGHLHLRESHELHSSDKHDSDGIHLLVSHSLRILTVVSDSKIVRVVEPGNLIEGNCSLTNSGITDNTVEVPVTSAAVGSIDVQSVVHKNSGAPVK
jgi:hypothetical protein